MDKNEKTALEKIRGQLASQTLPRWEELPDLDLYMDQILALIGRYLNDYPGQDKSLTASMVNNYVKLGIIPPPLRKRYSRIHLAHLLIICILKPSLPIPVIKSLVDLALESAEMDDFYNAFCAAFEQSVLSASDSLKPMDDPVSPILSAALRAQAEQALANTLHAELLLKKSDLS